MVRIGVLDGKKLRIGGAELLDVKGPRWTDVVAQTEADLAPLAERYGLHKLEIEDCLHLDQRPKLEDYPDHHFLVLQAFSCANGNLAELTMHELHFIFGADWLITVHEKPNTAIDAVWKKVEAEPTTTLGRGADFVTYLIADLAVDGQFPVLESFTETIEALQGEVFENPSSEVMERIFELKRSLAEVRRVLAPQREVVGMLARHEVPGIDKKTRVYFRDVYDHLVRVYDQIDGARDALHDAMNAYQTAIANRTNEITRQLTIFASVFLPLSFIVGFFGQNFDVLGGPVFFWVMLASLVALPLVMWWWFRHKEWT